MPLLCAQMDRDRCLSGGHKNSTQEHTIHSHVYCMHEYVQCSKVDTHMGHIPAFKNIINLSEPCSLSCTKSCSHCAYTVQFIAAHLLPATQPNHLHTHTHTQAGMHTCTHTPAPTAMTNFNRPTLYYSSNRNTPQCEVRTSC